MPSTPSLTIRSNSELGYHALKLASGVTPPTSRTELYRKVDSEYGGLFIMLTNSLRSNDWFWDWLAPSGKLASYFARAVDTGGATAESAVVSATLTLTRAKLQGVMKGGSSSNLHIGCASIRDIIPRDQDTQPTTGLYIGTGTKPLIRGAQPRTPEVRFSIRISREEDIERQVVQQIYRAITMVAYRDKLGGKFFGVLGGYTEKYMHPYTEIPITLELTDFKEGLS